MTLADLRKFAIRKQQKIHFPLKNGMECVISEHGIAQVPSLQGIPDFSLEQELASAAEFLLDPLSEPGAKHPPKPRKVSRNELETMASGATAAVAHDDHDDE